MKYVNWLIVFGQLVIRSGFIPKFFGNSLIIGGISYLIDTCTFILSPKLSYLTNIIVAITSAIDESAMILWLLIAGVSQGDANVNYKI